MVPLKRYGNYPPANAAEDGESESDIPAGAQRGEDAVLPLAKLKLKHSFEEESGNLNIVVEVREIKPMPTLLLKGLVWSKLNSPRQERRGYTRNRREYAERMQGFAIFISCSLLLLSAVCARHSGVGRVHDGPSRGTCGRQEKQLCSALL